MDKIQNTVPGFLTKLWTLVEDETTNSVIRWDDSGKSFHILDGGKLAKGLLPHFFKHSNLASFIRQLNMYGFHKVLNGAVERTAYSDDMQFAHAYFLRGRPELLERIKRKVTYGRPGILEPVEFVHSPAQNPQSVGRFPATVQLQTSDQSTVKSSAIVPIDTSQRQPARELPRLLQEISSLQAKQDVMSARLGSIKQENESLWRELHSLRARHGKQQLIVNKIVQFLITLVGQSGSSATRFVGGLKRKMAGSAFSSAPLMLDNKPANTHDSVGTSGVGVTLRDGAHTQSSVAAAAAELLRTASLMSESELQSPAGTRQTVFVEEVEDDDDYPDFSASSSGNASQNGRNNTSNRGRPAQKRRRLMNGEFDADDDCLDYSFDDESAGGVQISEIGNVQWPASNASRSASEPSALNRSASPPTNSTLRVDPSMLRPMRPSFETQQAVPTTITIDLKELLDSVADPQQQTLVQPLALSAQSVERNPVLTPTHPYVVSPGASAAFSHAANVNHQVMSVAPTSAPMLVTFEEPTIDLPELGDSSSAKNVISANLSSIQTQLDGLREFLANEQYTTDDNTLMELFNAETDVVPTGNLPDLGAASCSNDSNALPRYPTEIDSAGAARGLSPMATSRKSKSNNALQLAPTISDTRVYAELQPVARYSSTPSNSNFYQVRTRSRRGDELVEYHDPASMNLFGLYIDTGDQLQMQQQQQQQQQQLGFVTVKPEHLCARSSLPKQSIDQLAEMNSPFVVKTLQSVSPLAAAKHS